MSRRLLALAAAAVAVAAAPAPAVAAPVLPAAASDSAAPPVANYVVVLANTVTRPGAVTDALERARGFTAARRYSAALGGFAATLSRTQVERLRADPAVAFVAPDVAVSGAVARQTDSKETVPTGIRRVGAAAAPTWGAAAVAVVDTGLDLDNDDLNAVHGINCVRPGAPAKDDNGHGTHVGGTIGGQESRRGVVGVAPGARLYAVKVLDHRGGGSVSDVLCGLDWVAQEGPRLGIRAINLSLGARGRADRDCGRSTQDALHGAICHVVERGVTVVVSAGNNAAPIGDVAPAAYPEVLTVAGMTDTDGLPGALGGSACVDGEADDTPWSGSNFGTTATDAAHLIAAPATCVVSSKRGGGTLTMTGTSMAAPHVAGAVARCVGAPATPGPCASLTPAAIIDRLRADASGAASRLGFAGDLASRAATGPDLGPLLDASY